LAFALAHENQAQNARLAALNVLLILKCEPVSAVGAAIAAAGPGAGAARRQQQQQLSPPREMAVEDFDEDDDEDDDSALQARQPRMPTKAGRATGADTVSPVAIGVEEAKGKATGASPTPDAVTAGAVLPAPGLPAGKGKPVSISISCRELPRTRPGALSVDAVAAAFVQSSAAGAGGNFVFAGQTEWLRGEQNPDFAREVRLDHHVGAGQLVKFSIFDVGSSALAASAPASAAAGGPGAAHCIGSVLVRLDDVVAAGRELMYELLHEEPAKAARVKGAIIILTYEPDEAGAGERERSIEAGKAVAAASAARLGAGTTPTPARGTATGALLGLPEDSSDDEHPTPPQRLKRPAAAASTAGPSSGRLGGGRPAPLKQPAGGSLSDSDFTMSLGSPGSLTSLSPEPVAQLGAAANKRRVK